MTTRSRYKSKRGPPCSICKHPDRARIEATRIAGASLDAIAAKFTVSRFSVHRHMHAHVREADRLQYISDIPIAELAQKAATEGVSLLDYFAIVRATLMTQFQLCASVGDKNGVAILAGRLTEVLRAIGSATGEIMKSPMVQNVTNTVNFVNSPMFTDLQSMLVRKLAGHPDALAAVVDGLAELERRSAPRPLAGPVIEHEGSARAA